MLILAKCYIKQNELEKAFDIIEFVIKNKPELQESYLLLSEINNRLKERESQNND